MASPNLTKRALWGANKAQRLAARHIPKDARCILEHENGSALYVYEAVGGLYYICFWGTAGRPFEHHRCRSEAQRQDAIATFKRSVEQSLELRDKMAAERKATANTFKAGDIVNTSWGYDQTNVDFFAVTRVTAGCVWVRPIASDAEETGFMSGKCWPAMPIRYTGEETRHVVRGGHFSINGHGASLTTGDQYYSSYA